MKILAIILNVFIPGVGSFVIAKPVQAVFQIIIWAIGFFLTLTAIGAILGIPMMFGAWLWGVILAATYDSNKVVVVTVNNERSENMTPDRQTPPI